MTEAILMQQSGYALRAGAKQQIQLKQGLGRKGKYSNG